MRLIPVFAVLWVSYANAKPCSTRFQQLLAQLGSPREAAQALAVERRVAEAKADLLAAYQQKRTQSAEYPSALVWSAFIELSQPPGKDARPPSGIDLEALRQAEEELTAQVEKETLETLEHEVRTVFPNSFDGLMAFEKSHAAYCRNGWGQQAIGQILSSRFNPLVTQEIAERVANHPRMAAQTLSPAQKAYLEAYFSQQILNENDRSKFVSWQALRKGFAPLQAQWFQQIWDADPAPQALNQLARELNLRDFDLRQAWDEFVAQRSNR